MLKKTVLEFGGSDPYLILEAADLELAAISTKGRLVNSGQSCIAAKRFIVVDKVSSCFRGTVRQADERRQDRRLAHNPSKSAQHDQTATHPPWPVQAQAWRRKVDCQARSRLSATAGV